MNNSFNVSVVIVNYNTTEYLRDCLKSIIQFTKDVSYEIIVVDNKSPDREIENLPAEFSEVKFFFRDVNDGFGSGCNYGADKSSGDYVAFVNPDIKFNSDCLKSMFDFMESDPDTGACSPVLKDFDGNYTYVYNYFPNYKWELNEAMGIGNDKKLSQLLNVLDEDQSSNNVLEVDWVTGACLFVRIKLFKELNGYDDDYFLYYEDTDLQFRIRESGYRIVILNNLEVLHFTNSSIRSENGENVFFFHINRSRIIYMYKNLNIIKRNIIRIFYIFGITVRLIVLPFRKSFVNNKKQKYFQYKRMLKLYFLNYDKVLKSKLTSN